MATLESIETQIEELTEHIDEKFDEIDAQIESLVVHNKCAVCQGTGEVNTPAEGEPGPPYTCPRCGGDGTIKFSTINTTGDD